jgi:hypothetical protein
MGFAFAGSRFALTYLFYVGSPPPSSAPHYSELT